MSSLDCWLVPLDLGPDGWRRAWDLLSVEERARAERFRHDRDRHRFIVAHGHLRWLLGRALGQDPAGLRMVTGPGGKPELADHRLRFNLSHSGDWAAVAVSDHGEVGVDIERVRPFDDLASMIRVACSPREIRGLDRFEPGCHLDAFFQLWTRKEAYLKAVGTGLSTPLDSFSVTVSPDQIPRLEEGGDPAYAIMDLPLVGPAMADYRGAVARHGGIAAVNISMVDKASF